MILYLIQNKMIQELVWTTQQAAESWGISERRVSKYCEEGRIQGAERIGKSWVIPIDSVKPVDARSRSDFVAHDAAKPFIKWAGGKGQLLDFIREAYPPGLGSTIKRYAEPFIGGGAVLFDVLNNYDIEEAYISDINTELITTYTTIRDNVSELIEVLTDLEKEHVSRDMDSRKEFFLENRERYNKQIVSQNPDPLAVSSLFIYLNKTCFNGLYRVNSKGLFNVPSGVYKNPTICDRDNLLNVSDRLQKVTIKNCRYSDSWSFIDENTFVYFDPPYRPLTVTSSFTSYTEFSFDDEEQKNLADYVHKLCDRGVHVAVSNSDPKNVDPNDDFFDDLYSFASVHRVRASRMINSKASGRGKINELLITNYELKNSGSISLEDYLRRSGENCS